ncbi:MAG: hypothetical protein AAGJ35_13835, partial [Myxococcota bacterium]
AEGLEGLKALNLNNCGIGDAGVHALAVSKHLIHLERLELFFNGIKDDGARELASAEHLSGLRVLDLGGNQIGDDGIRALSNAHDLGYLEDLNVLFNDTEDFQALRESSYLANLRCVTFYGEDDVDRDFVEPDILLWDRSAPLHQRTKVLAHMCKESPNIEWIPQLLALLEEESSEGALSLWILRLLKTWDVGEHCIEALTKRTYEHKAWEMLRVKLLERGEKKREMLGEEQHRLERRLLG